MARFRYEIAVGCEDLGRRVSVRYRLSSGGFSDVLGVLETCDERSYGIRDRTGKLRKMIRVDVVSAKLIPPPTPRR